MKKLLLGFFLLFIPFCSAMGQKTAGVLTSAGTAPACLVTACIGAQVSPSNGGATFTLSGTFSGTVTFYGSGDNGVTLVALNVTPSNSTTATTTASAAGTWQVNPAGYTNVYMIMTTYASGTANATIQLSTASALLSSGGGLTPQQTTPSLPLISNLIGQYEMVDGGTSAIKDSSVAGNSCTITAGGTAPTPIAITGGYQFNGGQYGACPTALNAAQTVLVFVGFQPTGVTTSLSSLTHSAPIAGNGNGTTSNAVLFDLANQSSGGTNQGQSGFNVGIACNGSSSATGTSKVAGITSFAWVLGATNQTPYINGINDGNTVGGIGNATTCQTAGVYQIGGAAAGSGFASTTYYTGQIYKVFIWNAALNAAQILQAQQYGAAELMAQGLVPTIYPSDKNNIVAAIGDSETNGGSQYNWTAGIKLTGTSQLVPIAAQIFPYSWFISNDGASGVTCQTLSSQATQSVDPVYRPAGSQKIIPLWCGTNDIAASTTPAITWAYMASECQGRIQVGYRCLLMTTMSRSGIDANRDIFNGIIRQNWANIGASGLCDVAANANVGADGAWSNATWFSDGLHLTTQAVNQITVPMFSRCINRVYAPHDFSSASTYANGGGGNNSYVQNGNGPLNFANAVAANSETLTWTATAGLVPIAGDMLFACSTWTGAGITLTIADGTNGSYSMLTVITNGSNHTQCGYLLNTASPTGNLVITFTYSGAGGTQIYINAWEFRGVNTLDQQASAAGGPSTTATPTGITTTKNNVLAIGYSGTGNAVQVNWTSATGYLPVSTATGFAIQSPIEFQTNAPAATYTPSFTLSASTAWQSGAVTFYEGGATQSAQDIDVFANLNCAVGGLLTFDEQTSVGLTGQSINRLNVGTAPCSIVPLGSETINGQAKFSLLPGQSACFNGQLVSASAAGSNWVTCGSAPVGTPPCLLASSASPLACGAATQGKVAIPVSLTSYVIDTTAVYSGSVITLTPTTDNTGIPGSPTCTLDTTAFPSVSATTPGTSFTIAETSVASITCYAWKVQ